MNPRQARARAAPRTLWSLAVLGLLRERPMHPYEIQRQLRVRHTADLLALKPGSLYHAIEQLQRADLIEPLETSRAGRWPERTVYRITPAGADELIAWLRDTLATPAREPSQFLAGLTHIPYLAPADALHQLQLRMVGLEASIASMAAVEAGIGELIGREAVLEVEYARCVATAELAWVRSVVDDLRRGKLHWSVDNINNDIQKNTSASEHIENHESQGESA